MRKASCWSCSAKTMASSCGLSGGLGPTPVAEIEAGKPQATAWAWERPDGGRAFGFTGGHFHLGWGHDDQRKLLLNAILWTAGMDVPGKGVETTLTAADLQMNLDPPEFEDDLSRNEWFEHPSLTTSDLE